MELLKDFEPSQEVIEKIKRLINEAGRRGVSKAEIFAILEEETDFDFTPEDAVEIVKDLIVEEVMASRPEFVEYFLVSRKPGTDGGAES